MNNASKGYKLMTNKKKIMRTAKKIKENQSNEKKTYMKGQ